jgi:hypothetical protein
MKSYKSSSVPLTSIRTVWKWKLPGRIGRCKLDHLTDHDWNFLTRANAMYRRSRPWLLGPVVPCKSVPCSRSFRHDYFPHMCQLISIRLNWINCCWIRASHSSDYEEYCFLGCNAVQSGRSSPAIRRNALLLSSGSKSKQIRSMLHLASFLLVYLISLYFLMDWMPEHTV